MNILETIETDASKVGAAMTGEEKKVVAFLSKEAQTLKPYIEDVISGLNDVKTVAATITSNPIIKTTLTLLLGSRVTPILNFLGSAAANTIVTELGGTLEELDSNDSIQTKALYVISLLPANEQALGQKILSIATAVIASLPAGSGWTLAQIEAFIQDIYSATKS